MANRVFLPARSSSRSCLALFLSVSVAPAFAQVSAETESNDTLDTADFIELAEELEYLHLGSLGNSASSPDLDVDVIELGIFFGDQLPKQLTAVVTGGNPTVDLCLRLFDDEGNQVAFNDNFEPTNPNAKIAITLHEDAPTAYYLAVSSRSNTLYDPNVAGSGRPGPGGDYQIRLQVEDEASPNSPYEPNDAVYSATDLGDSSVSVRGEFIGDGAARAKDVDAYRLQLDGPAMIYATARASAGSVLDPLLRLRTCADSTDGWVLDLCGIGISDDVSADDHTAHVQTFVTEPRDVYVLISGSPNRRYDPAEAASGERGSVGYYDLDIQIEPLGLATPNEPNDSIPLATPLPLFIEGRPAEITVEGVIGDGPYAHMRGDRDFYQIRLADEGKFLHIRNAEDSEIVTRFALFDPENRLLARSSGIGSAQEMIIPAICGFTTGDPTTAYLAVTALDQRPIIDPNIPPAAAYGTDYAIEPLATEMGNYKISVTAVEPASACANEPNETIPTAAPTGIVDTGYFVCNAELGDNPKCAYADIDMWSFVVDQPPVMLQLRLEHCADADELEPPTRVFDDAGHLLGWLAPTTYDAPRSLLLGITVPGTYVIAVGGDFPNYYSEFDPFEECFNDGWLGPYSIALSLLQGPPDAPLPTIASADAMGAEPLPVLYASRVGGDARFIDLLNSLDGTRISSFTAPQWPLSGAESLAASADNLLFGGIGRYPIFHALAPLSGQVVSSFLAWFGSGQYGDAAMLSGVLYIVDLRQQAIHAVDPIAWRLLKTIPVKNSLGITMTGAMAALAGPNRLYVADAIEEERIYEIDPVTGALTGTFASGELRPHALAGLGDSELFVGNWEASEIEVRSRDGTVVDGFSTTSPVASLSGAAFLTAAGDTDGDGDIDLRDVAALQRCFAVEPPSEACAGADVNDDGAVDFADAGLIAANLTGM